MKKYTYSIVVLLLVLSSVAALAQTIIIPRPDRPDRHIPIPYIQQRHVTVDISGNLAKTTTELIVYNPGARLNEGTLLFPIPAGASVSDFYLWIDGKKVRGELLDKNEARKIYQDIVRRMIDPALLEMTKFNVFKASIFPIGPKQTRKVSITYSESLNAANGLIHYNYLMKDRQVGSHQPLKSFSFQANIKAPVAITTAYSPSYNVDISRTNDREMVAGFEKQNFSPDRDLHLYAGYSPEEMAVYAARYHEPGESRDFAMFLLSPTPKIETNRKVPKDVIFVLDTSGSMQHDNKIGQALNALSFGLHTMNDQDRFAVLTFATTVRNFNDSLLPANEKNIQLADEYLQNKVSATGSTNIHDALKLACEMFDTSGMTQVMSQNRSRYIIFLTDGLPTAVERDPQVIIKHAAGWARKDVRLFTWGVGYDVDTILLDTLAGNHGGVSEYVKPKEDMEAKLGGFFSKISHPVMTGMKIKFEGLKVDEMFPRELPDVFKGSQLTLFARVEGEGKAKVILTGNYLGEQQTFTYELEPVVMKEADHMAHLWAARKIGFLLDEIRTGGENDELKQAVIDLSKKYGIVTPYTSYLVTEPEMDDGVYDMGAQPVVTRQKTMADAPAGRSGEQAVQYSQDVREMKEEAVAPEPTNSVKILSGKTFVMTDGFWTDSAFTEGMKTVEIKFGSDAYFDLINKDPRMASWLSAGKQVILVHDSVAYRITM